MQSLIAQSLVATSLIVQSLIARRHIAYRAIAHRSSPHRLSPSRLSLVATSLIAQSLIATRSIACRSVDMLLKIQLAVGHVKGAELAHAFFVLGEAAVVDVEDLVLGEDLIHVPDFVGDDGGMAVDDDPVL